MPTACITQPDCRVSLKSERIEVYGFNEQTQRDEVLRQIPLRDLERLVVAESVQVTSQALAALLRAEIPVSVMGWNGQFLGAFLPHGGTGFCASDRWPNRDRQALQPTPRAPAVGRVAS
jgi:CRISPR-associated protein Cas1